RCHTLVSLSSLPSYRVQDRPSYGFNRDWGAVENLSHGVMEFFFRPGGGGRVAAPRYIAVRSNQEASVLRNLTQPGPVEIEIGDRASRSNCHRGDFNPELRGSSSRCLVPYLS